VKPFTIASVNVAVLEIGCSTIVGKRMGSAKRERMVAEARVQKMSR
jgi:hypothetical protein